MKRTNQKGFSMIELLGAIVILGIISLIAVTAVTKTTSNSRKDAYLSTVKIHKNTIEELINQEEYYVYDENTVYYFDYRLAIQCINNGISALRLNPGNIVILFSIADHYTQGR